MDGGSLGERVRGSVWSMERAVVGNGNLGDS
jgi:hypothetical protein